MDSADFDDRYLSVEQDKRLRFRREGGPGWISQSTGRIHVGHITPNLRINW